jgi:hypothetical protein
MSIRHSNYIELLPNFNLDANVLTNAVSLGSHALFYVFPAMSAVRLPLNPQQPPPLFGTSLAVPPRTYVHQSARSSVSQGTMDRIAADFPCIVEGSTKAILAALTAMGSTAAASMIQSNILGSTIWL